jgi:hypothetical protein
MASEDKLRDALQRGDRAKLLLQNELLIEAFEKLENKIMEEWKATDPEDKERREDAWRSLKLLQTLQGQFRRIVTTGEAASKELVRIRKESLLKKVMK